MIFNVLLTLSYQDKYLISVNLSKIHVTRWNISLCPIVANMVGLIGQIALKAHRSHCCAQGSSVKLRPGLISQTAPRAHQSNCAQGSSVKLRPGLISQTAPRAHLLICARAHPPNCTRVQVGASGPKIYFPNGIVRYDTTPYI